jgi:hypothetical protein
MFHAATGSIDLVRQQAVVHEYPLQGSLALVTARMFVSCGAAGFSPPSNLIVRRAEARRSTGTLFRRALQPARR